MSVFRKENGSLVKKAGRALVDLALSLTSNNAIANRVVSEGMALRNVTLYNGKLYQLNLDGTKGVEIKMGMPDLNYSSPLKTFNNANSLSYTASQECYLMGTANMNVGAGGVGTVKINNTTIVTVNPLQNSWANNFPMQVPATKLKSGDRVVASHVCDGLSIFKPL